MYKNGKELTGSEVELISVWLERKLKHLSFKALKSSFNCPMKVLSDRVPTLQSFKQPKYSETPRTDQIRRRHLQFHKGDTPLYYSYESSPFEQSLPYVEQLQELFSESLEQHRQTNE